MKLNLLLACYLLLPYISFGQISVDSLLSEINRNFTKTGDQKFLREPFTRYVNADSSEVYCINYDEEGAVEDYIGLAIVHYKLDEKRRKTLIEGFNCLGNYSYWDFSPLIHISYEDNVALDQINAILNEICDCDTNQVFGTIKVSHETYFSPTRSRLMYKIISADSLHVLEYAEKISGEKISFRNNVAFTYHRYHQPGHLYVHDRFYNEHFELQDGPHNVYDYELLSSETYIPYAYSIKKVSDDTVLEVNYFNSQHELVNRDLRNTGGPIALPFDSDDSPILEPKPLNGRGE